MNYLNKNEKDEIKLQFFKYIIKNIFTIVPVLFAI